MPARPHPEPYEPRRRLEPAGGSASETVPTPEDEAPIAWWEWPVVVLLTPVRWAGRAAGAAARAGEALVESVVRAVLRVLDVVLIRPLRVLSRLLLSPVRWLGRAAWALLKAPASWLGAAGRWAGRGLDSLARAAAVALAWVFRPVAVLMGWLLIPSRFAARTLARCWAAAGRLGALVWRTVTWPVRWLARVVSTLVTGPLRALGRSLDRIRAAVRTRTSAFRLAQSRLAERLRRPFRRR